MAFQKLLLKAANDLGQDDVRALVFLCADLLGRNLGTVHSASDLFSRLSDQDHLSEDRPHLLVELLGIIQRTRLIRDLNLACVVPSNLVSPYRKLLHSLSEQLNAENLKNIKFLLNNKLSRKMLEDSTTLEIFIEMEHRDLIRDTDLNFLESLIQPVCPMLLENIHQFKAQNSNLQLASQETAFEPITQHPTQINQAPTSNPHAPSEEADIIQPIAERLSLNAQQDPPSLFNDQDEHEVGSPEPRLNSPQEEQTSSGAEASTMGPEDLVLSAVDSPDFSVPYSDTYPMNAGTRGCCLIINNYKFNSSTLLQNREGTMVDEASLDKVFTWLGFKVESHQDCTSQKMLSLMQDLAKGSQREWDCVACCILSHGQEGCVYGVDSNSVKIKKLMEPFVGSKCPSLAQKPKLFFIQACQAIVYTDGEESEHGCVDTDVVQANDCIPDHADFLMAMATVPSFVSFREKGNGTWYIQSLCQNLVHMVPRGCDLVSILTKVNADVSKKTDRTRRKKQMPQPAFTLTKKLVFPPPSSPAPVLQNPTSCSDI